MALDLQKDFDAGRELLKWIAIVTMTIDHIGAILYPELVFLRIIGRLSFPLFCYLIALGMETTRNVKNYFIRLFIFALISQTPFTLALGVGPFESLNIFFTLSFGVLFVYFHQKNSLLLLIPLLVSAFLPFDYSFYGIALIGCMHVLKKDMENGVIFVVLLNLFAFFLWEAQFFSLLALPLILLHRNGSLKFMNKKAVNRKEPYPLWRKYFFYVYYPLHLTVLYLIKAFWI